MRRRKKSRVKRGSRNERSDGVDCWGEGKEKVEEKKRRRENATKENTSLLPFLTVVVVVTPAFSPKRGLCARCTPHLFPRTQCPTLKLLVRVFVLFDRTSASPYRQHDPLLSFLSPHPFNPHSLPLFFLHHLITCSHTHISSIATPKHHDQQPRHSLLC